MRAKYIGTTGVLSLFVLSFAGSGCVIDDGSSPPTEPNPGDVPTLVAPPDSSSTRAQLQRPRTFAVQPGGTAAVTAHRAWGGDIVESASLPVLGGTLEVQALPDGRIEVVAMALQFGDIHLSSTSVPPDGLDLTQVSVSLDGLVADARWTGDASAAASARSELLLDWSLRADGSVLPMATQHIDDVPLTIEIAPAAGGGLTVALHATRSGVFWEWTGLLDLSDLRLDVQAAEK